MSDTRIYIVTLKSRDDLDSFYEDMETPGGNLHIPNRVVDVADRRPISRNTHYYLTDTEAEQLRNDPRVLAVTLHPTYTDIVAKPAYSESSNLWDKSFSNAVDPTDGTRRNWGLLRVFNGQQTPNWGYNATSSITGTININQSGYNVDVVIVDGHFDPALSELQKNSDGTGGSRVQQINWLAPSGTYVYQPYIDPTNQTLTNDNNHGAHVAGTVAGNTQGWARNANIYNISPYNGEWVVIWDYIVAWHNTKPINPSTGRRNPTIINNSWALTYTVPYTAITQIHYQGNILYGPFSIPTLNQYGLFPSGGYVDIPIRFGPLDADIQDCIDSGIIVVGAAGNESTLIDYEGTIDAINKVYFTSPTTGYESYSLGSSPGASSISITVGAIDAVATEKKVDFSNCGPRINLYAPGTNIMSCVNSNTGLSSGAVADPRGSGYLVKKSGTSMAAPQVTGVLACLLQVYPNLTQSDVMDYLQKTCSTGLISDPSPTQPSNTSSLQGSPNVYLAYQNEREETGSNYPATSYWFRPQSGAVWPRTNYRKTP